MKNNNSSKTFVAIGIGAALFFVLGRFVAIPSPVPNTNISLQYAVLALLAAMSDRPVLGRHPMVELGHHLRLCRRCGGPVHQKAAC